MIRNLLAGTLVSIAFAVVMPSVAHAEYYMSKGKAQSFARHYVRTKYGSSGVVASCRPQGRRAPKSGYIYHRWVCGWADSDGCGGRLTIIGSRGTGNYYGRVSVGYTC